VNRPARVLRSAEKSQRVNYSRSACPICHDVTKPPSSPSRWLTRRGRGGSPRFSAFLTARLTNRRGVASAMLSRRRQKLNGAIIHEPGSLAISVAEFRASAARP